MLLIYSLFKINKIYDFCREYMFVQSFRFSIKVTREQLQTQDKQERQQKGPKSSHAALKQQEKR